MKCVVTGAAGFVGSHLAEELLRQGHEVVGIDCFVPYYDPAIKKRNLSGLEKNPRFRFHAVDLRRDPLDGLFSDCEVVFHLAAMAGLTKSWTDFDGYWTCNVVATRQLVEALLRSAPKLLKRFLYVSTSSVYGKFASGDETLPTRPVSPYGVTKLAGEHLCQAYAETRNLPLVILRYFSIYGPRQRPDMGYHLFIRSALEGKPVVVYGDGQQVRGNTYVSDCVSATIKAVEAPVGEVYNVGGGETASVWDILHRLEKIVGRSIAYRQEPARPGDQRYTFAETSKLRRHLGWQPCTTLDEGLRAQWEWQRRELGPASPST
jgi:nucleoside-diphosphate-sugar epimerase